MIYTNIFNKVMIFIKVSLCSTFWSSIQHIHTRLGIWVVLPEQWDSIKSEYKHSIITCSTLYNKYTFFPNRIYNIDESGVNTAPKKLQKEYC